MSARGIACTVRVEKGVEISAACGQLRAEGEPIELGGAIRATKTHA
jgi:adenine C2-methylase RlmN of 23S rRNA A2503 and tRNA A37